jgi:hypothetical protein
VYLVIEIEGDKMKSAILFMESALTIGNLLIKFSHDIYKLKK